MSDLISRSELLKEVEKYKFGAISDDAEREYIKKTILDFIICQPTAYDIEKVVEELEERTDFLKDCTKYGNKNAEQQAGSYSTMMMYEVADLVDDLISSINSLLLIKSLILYHSLFQPSLSCTFSIFYSNTRHICYQ